MLGSNFTKFLSFLKQQISFSSNFASIFRVMRYMSSVLLSWNFIYFTEPIKLQIWWNFMWAVENLKFCTLMGSFCPNHVQFQLKKYRRAISHDNEEWSNVYRKLTFCLKNDMRNLMNFNSSSEKSENLHFDGIFLSKVCDVWAKIIWRVVSWKMTYGFKNDKEFGEFLHK